MNICYHGPLKDYSGYGEANRHDVSALHAAGVDVYTTMVSYVNDASDFGELGALIERLSAYRDYKIKIIHTTPDQFLKFHEPGKYHIGRVVWETDKLPDAFAEGCKVLDEIWTNSKATELAIRNAGILKPVFIFPQPVEIERASAAPYTIPEFKGYLFYSVFEWIERKNPAALLEAFYSEFRKNEKVGLLLKTYYHDFTNRHKSIISAEAKKLKGKFKGNKPVFLYKELMDRSQVDRVHATGDCFVSAHRGEGWGIPQAEAMLAGKPIISTGYGGVHEYLTAREAFLVPYGMISARNRDNTNWYSPDQNWAAVDIQALRKAMRYAYMHKKEAAGIGANAQKFVIEQFSPERVGKLMAARLAEIEREL